jgi:hypothetical protein
MAQWAVVLPAERYAREKLFANESVALGGAGPQPGDGVLLIADGEERVLVGLGRVSRATSAGGEPVAVYTHRLFDDPLAVDGLDVDGPGVHPVDVATYQAWAGKVGADRRVDASKRTWLVSLDLPIEAGNPAEAVRAFWSYVYELGPRELPAFVSPSDDELAMQAFVLGAETNLDPEDDD